MLLYYKNKLSSRDFGVIQRFAIYGLIGGALGFGLGSLWMVVGSRVHTILSDYWKCMEFTFGFLLGGAMGLAAWKEYNVLNSLKKEQDALSDPPLLSVPQEMLMLGILAILVYAVVPYS